MPGTMNRHARHDSPERPMHQPADISRELLRLRPGQKHAVVERVQKTIFRDPPFLLDEDLVHHRICPRAELSSATRNQTRNASASVTPCAGVVRSGVSASA